MSQGEQPRIHHSEDNRDSRPGCGWFIFLAFLIIGIVCYCYRNEIQERLNKSKGMDDMDSMNLSMETGDNQSKKETIAEFCYCL